MMADIEIAAKWVAEARSVVVLTGAGMSAESSVPTFRDAQTGLWERFEPEHLATEDAFRADPSLVWTWYVWRSMLIDTAVPNAGHTAIGAWQKHLAVNNGSLTVATQNVDDLHERGGA
ncbi:MAG: NAD-dependent deacylase, partial [Yaniella sp.]|nr:NAD-dependent deacylase [Yaniella sp.]